MKQLLTQIRDKFMKTKELASIIIFAVLFAVALTTSIVYKEDNEIEEHIETVLEDIIEYHLGLDDDALKDKIDVSPFSPEQAEWLTEEDKKALHLN